jgi:hypothetical protein
LCSAPDDPGANDNFGYVTTPIAFKFKQLMDPHRIFVGGAPRIGGDAPARPNLSILDHCETRLVFPASMASTAGAPNPSAVSTSISLG